MTINLEKELLRTNRMLATPQELLIIKEYEKHGDMVYDDVLHRLEVGKNIIHGKTLKTQISSLKQQTLKFDQSRVFHISQIKNICDKYYLRFLNPNIYKGAIDKDLSIKVSTFELAHNVKCYSANTRIMAPLESFNLEEKPKDPLFFYQINSEYFYLIHKWGNDLSITRRFISLLSNATVSWIILGLIIPLLIFIILKPFSSGFAGFTLLIIGISSNVVFFVHTAHALASGDEDEFVRIKKINKFDSSYED